MIPEQQYRAAFQLKSELGEELGTGVISLINKTLINNTYSNLQHIRVRRHRDIGQIEDKDWDQILQHPREFAIKSNFILIQLKTLHRALYHRSQLLKD